MAKSALFTQFKLRQLVLSNRIVIAPMCQYSADGCNGNIGDWHTVHLGSFSHSGAGMLIVEATAVLPEGRITPKCAGLWCSDNEDSFSRVLSTVRKHSLMPLAIQLSHAGRKASCDVPWHGGGQLAPGSSGGWQTVAPSPISFRESDGTTPHALDERELTRVRDGFVQSALRADKLGFDAVELHAAHGYLLHQFLSPISNHRKDCYGGSLQNRMRFPLDVFRAVREVFPQSKPVGVRISATDWMDDCGWGMKDASVLARELVALGCDYIHVSGGGLSPLQKIVPQPTPGYQVPFSKHIKRETGATTITVGMITEAAHAERIVASGDANLVAIGRGILYNPRWPWHAAAELSAQVHAPPQYWRSSTSGNDIFMPE